MTTIRLVDAATVTGKAKEIFDAVLLRERRVFGAESVSNIWRCSADGAPTTTVRVMSEQYMWYWAPKSITIMSPRSIFRGPAV